jgi:protease II
VYYKQTSLNADSQVVCVRVLLGMLFTPRAVQVLLDPNTLCEDGTASIRGTWFTDDGTLLAYGVSFSGSDWFTIRIRDVQTCEVKRSVEVLASVFMPFAGRG